MAGSKPAPVIRVGNRFTCPAEGLNYLVEAAEQPGDLSRTGPNYVLRPQNGKGTALNPRDIQTEFVRTDGLRVGPNEWPSSIQLPGNVQ